MRSTASRFLAALFLICGASAAHAIQYPPGPGGAYPDTLVNIWHVQDPGADPFAVQPDTVWGIGGIITGFDTFPSGFAFYIQHSQGGPWTGVDVFTGGSNYQTLFNPPLALGDSVMCYGRMVEFQGETEIAGLHPTSQFSHPLVAVRRISQGNPLPPFFSGTVNQLHELPTNFFAEQWEGCLVKVPHKLRVGRTSLTGGLGTFSSFLAVDHVACPPGSPGPCDSLFVDGSTLANPAIAPPPVGSLVDSVRGIYNQRTRGYRIQIRDGADLFDSSPPSLVDAYSIANDSLRVIFDRNLTLTSAQNTAHYSLASFGSVDAAIRQAVDRNIVHLKITTPLVPGEIEQLTVNNVQNEQNNVPMTSPQSRTFVHGVLSLAYLQGPDPDSLTAVGGCRDVMRHLGTNNGIGVRLTIRGVASLRDGSTYFLSDEAGGERSGLQLFAPPVPLTLNRRYLIAGQPTEFFNESQMTSIVFVRDLGATPLPAPEVQPVKVLRDNSSRFCNPHASGLGTSTHELTGEDFEGAFVKVENVKIVENRNPGQSFFAAGPYPTFTDTILIDNNVPRTFQPVKGQIVSVTGVLDLSFDIYRIQPRGDADIVVNPALGVEDGPAAGLSFAVYPNPARVAQVVFTLPRRDQVELAVFDLQGRRLATLARGSFEAGVHRSEWDGRDESGTVHGSGVYFYRLRVGSETYRLRAVRME